MKRWSHSTLTDRARSAESSLSAIPSTSRLLNIDGVTSTIPILDVLRPSSISRISDFPRTTSFSLNQTDAFCFSSSSCSTAAPRLSSQAWHRKTSRRSGYFSEIRTACLCTGERVRNSEGAPMFFVKQFSAPEHHKVTPPGSWQTRPSVGGGPGR